MTSGVSCEQLAEPQQQQQQQNRTRPVQQQEDIQQREQVDLIGGRQSRSESGDSGQLSLISSFGSISINQIVNGQQHPRLKQRLPSESSQEFSGSNYVDYQQYCSLMLLNSFDCFEEDHGSKDNNNQHQLLYESLKSLPNDKQDNLAERRARWFAGLEQRLQLATSSGGVGGAGSHCCCEEHDKNKLPEAQLADLDSSNRVEDLEHKGNNKGKSRKGGKKFVAALAATQSSLMDKFWTHMVKRAAVPNNSASNGKKHLSPTDSAQKERQQVVEPAKATATMAITAPQSGGGGIHLLSDLSRRLVRRCGGGGSAAKQVKVNRVQSTSESALEMSKSSSDKRAMGGDHHQHHHQIASAAAGSERKHHSGTFIASPSSASCQQLSGTTGSVGVASNNLNASISTLNTATTPSGCCYCDNETCSSSGFVSSSTANTAPAPISSVASRATGGTNSPSSTTAATSNCCNDSIANHSCSSSMYNDHHSTSVTALPCQEQENSISVDVEDKVSNNKVVHNQVAAQVRLAGAPTATGTMSAASPVTVEVQHLDVSPPTIGAIIGALDGSRSVSTDGKVHQGPVSDGRGQLKDSQKASKGSSFLRRARNSNINIATLAPITSKFNCSASVGNLWNHHHHGRHANSPNLSNNVPSELLTPEHDSVQTLEYVAYQEFDQFKPEHHRQDTSCESSRLDEKLAGTQSCGEPRKLSSKDKCRRQKDAERVEKLRLLVSYLRSGSSQPVVNPVTLEADEIELAERYKLHMALRDDLLNLADGETLPSPPTSDHLKSNELSPIMSSVSSRGQQLPPQTTVSVSATSNTSPSTSSCSMGQHHRSSIGVMNYRAGFEGMNANKTGDMQGIANKSSAGPTVSITRSIPQIGQIPWILRHSISDPGNKFGHNFACDHAVAANCSSTVSAFSAGQHQEPIGQLSPRMVSISSGQVVLQSSSTSSSSPHQRANSCKNTSSNYHIGHNNQNINNSSSSSTSIQPNKQPARLFYIDDFDAPHANFPQSGPKSDEGQQHLMSTPTANVNESLATMMTQATSSGNFTSSICSGDSQPSPAIPVESTTLSSSKSCSAWTNPQNLATWIDNEVKSLVHDLEVNESQQQKLSSDSHKHHHSGQRHNLRQGNNSVSSHSSCKNKEGKRKWLSVTSANMRRSSSGAQST